MQKMWCRTLNIRGIVPCCMTAHITPSRNATGKHWDPKFRKLRGKKIIKIPLPDYDELRNHAKLSIEEMRSVMKKKGIVPGREWDEKPMCVSCTGAIIDSYVPHEGDGKMSLISKSGVQQKTELVGKKGKSYMSLRKIRNFEYDFDVPTLAENCQKIYIDAHKALEELNEDRLHELVTERCYPELMENVAKKSIRWKFIQSLESPRVVHIRHEELMSKENVFAQATIRFHTQQILAVYDRFGRLMHGSEDIVKDVLEYVVFEKHLTNLYGTWRIHAKIIPDWKPPRDSILKTFVKPVSSDTPKESNDVTNIDVKSDVSSPQPAVA